MQATLFLRPIWLVLASALTTSACTIPEPAAARQRQEFSPPEGVSSMLHLQAKMRDGARLDTSVWLPSAEGSFPVVLTRTPYSSEMGPFQKLLLQKGYAVVEQHERGRFLSEGEVRMLNRADEDGWDTLDWITSQAWSNGRIATYGCSSSAENQLKLASLGHPSHRAMVVGSSGVGVAQIGPHREQGNFWRGGAWQQGWMDYFLAEMQLFWPQLPPGLSDLERQQLSSSFLVENSSPVTASDLERMRMHLPMVDIARELNAPDTELEEYLARGPSGTAWAQDRVTDRDVIKVPGLWAEALYDISPPSAVAFFDKTRQENPIGNQAIVITNGQHCSFGQPRTEIGDRPLGNATFDWSQLTLAWLDRWMKDDKFAATPRSPITAYMAGANRWANFDRVPHAGKDDSRTFFLTSMGSANTAAGDGQLADTAPDTSHVDRFAYDPANPVISHGGQISGVGADQKDGAYDQREIETRADVLVYTSAPLAEDLAVFGYIDTSLYVASDAPDTDFTVKLVDVAPDGVAWNIADTILRMRYREGDARPMFLEQGHAYLIAPPPMLAANVFLAGHSVRIEVSSSNFPSYARNLNTPADPYTTTETRIANNSVLHGPTQPSKITLPVVALPQRFLSTPGTP